MIKEALFGINYNKSIKNNL